MTSQRAPTPSHCIGLSTCTGKKRAGKCLYLNQNASLSMNLFDLASLLPSRSSVLSARQLGSAFARAFAPFASMRTSECIHTHGASEQKGRVQWSFDSGEERRGNNTDIQG
jgi:hypothetical protein